MDEKEIERLMSTAESSLPEIWAQTQIELLRDHKALLLECADLNHENAVLKAHIRAIRAAIEVPPSDIGASNRWVQR
jgi:hypothetical protein